MTAGVHDAVNQNHTMTFPPMKNNRSDMDPEHTEKDPVLYMGLTAEQLRSAILQRDEQIRRVLAQLEEALWLLWDCGSQQGSHEWVERRNNWLSAHTPTGKPRPKIVCICGSSRFCDKAAVWAWEFEKQGELALSMHLLPQWYWELTGKVGEGHGAEQEGVAHILDELHLIKIDMADRVFVVNEGGYIGERTSIEIEYAKKLGKPISYSHTPTGKEK